MKFFDGYTIEFDPFEMSRRKEIQRNGKLITMEVKNKILAWISMGIEVEFLVRIVVGTLAENNVISIEVVLKEALMKVEAFTMVLTVKQRQEGSKAVLVKSNTKDGPYNLFFIGTYNFSLHIIITNPTHP